ncbi:MAG: tetratricopeptide repeat protein [Saccharofermentanales bacterium]
MMTVSDQKEDSATQEGEEPGSVLVDYDKVVPDSTQHDFGAQEEEPIDEVHCAVCKVSERDRSENPDSVLCSACREQYIRYPIPRWIRIAMAAVAVIVVFAMISTPVAIRDYKIYHQSTESYNNKDYNTAVNGYLAINSNRAGSMKINERLFLSYAKAQRFYDAYVLLDERMAGKDASDETYDEINSYIELIDSYYYTVEKANSSFDENDIPGSMKALEALKGDEEISGAVLLFYMSQLNIYNGTLDLAVAQQKEACRAEPRFTFLNAYLGNLQRRVGEYGQAAETYRAALMVNGDDETALVGLGVLELLQGDNDEALKYIKEAYDLNKNGDYVAGAYAVALHTSGRTGEAQIVYNEYKNSEYYMEDDVIADYLADQATLEDIYITKEG